MWAEDELGLKAHLVSTTHSLHRGTRSHGNYHAQGTCLVTATCYLHGLFRRLHKDAERSAYMVTSERCRV